MTRIKMEKVVLHALKQCARITDMNVVASKVTDAIDIALLMEAGEPSESSGALPPGPASVVFAPIEVVPPHRQVEAIGQLIETDSAPVPEIPAAPPARTTPAITANAKDGIRWETKEMVSELERKAPETIIVPIKLLSGAKVDLEIVRNIIPVHGTDTVQLEYAPRDTPLEQGGVRHVFDQDEPIMKITEAVDRLREAASRMWSQVYINPVAPPPMMQPRIINP